MTKTQKFINKANIKFDNKFNYTEFIYNNAKTKSIIICPEHGQFEQTPDKHLNSKYGCPKCALAGRSQQSKGKLSFKPLKYSWEEMNKRLLTKFKTLSFSCSDYKGTQSSIEVYCKIHGKSYSNPHSLLHKQVKYGCKECGISKAKKTRTGSFEDFVKQANKLYDSKYTYTCEDYVNKKTIVECVCPIHGKFHKSAQKHISGQGCPICTTDALKLEGKLPGGYCETIFARNDELKNKAGIIYYLKIGKLFKIGITTDLTQRLRTLKNKFCSNIELIDYRKLPLYEAYTLEQSILTDYKEHRTFTEASTELFVKNVLNNKIPK